MPSMWTGWANSRPMLAITDSPLDERPAGTGGAFVESLAPPDGYWLLLRFRTTLLVDGEVHFFDDFQDCF